MTAIDGALTLRSVSTAYLPGAVWTINTEHRAWETTFREMLPSRALWSPVWPREPTTIRSAFAVHRRVHQLLGDVAGAHPRRRRHTALGNARHALAGDSLLVLHPDGPQLRTPGIPVELIELLIVILLLVWAFGYFGRGRL